MLDVVDLDEAYGWEDGRGEHRSAFVYLVVRKINGKWKRYERGEQTNDSDGKHILTGSGREIPAIIWYFAIEVSKRVQWRAGSCVISGNTKTVLCK